jgi:hypothetical protein
VFSAAVEIPVVTEAEFLLPTVDLFVAEFLADFPAGGPVIAATGQVDLLEIGRVLEAWC